MIPAPQPTHTWPPSEGLEPGTMFLLEQGDGLHLVMPIYRAVLACPACGVLTLITGSQYEGREPILCGGAACPAEYTLRDDQVYFRRAQ